MSRDLATPGTALPTVPRAPVRETPAIGTYAGRCGDTRLGSRGVSWLRRSLSEKRWQWFAAFDDDLAVGGAVVDAGFFATAFFWLFDRTARDLLVDADVVVPSPLVSVTTHPTVGHVASIDLPGYRLAMERTGATLSVAGRVAGTDIDLAVETDDRRAITAVCPVGNRTGGVNLTQKEPGVSVSGQVGEHTLDGVGFLDYSHGLLARETRWDWAFGHAWDTDGTPVAFNLVDLFNAGRENVVWVDGDPRSVGSATLDRGEQWRVTTACGTVDATLAVEGRREQQIDIGVVASAYEQPLGRWTGTVAGRDIEGVGVAEQHRTRW
jgi:hypothetical protein